MLVRRAQNSDIGQIARLHKIQFDNHFLAAYSETLIQKYYAKFLTGFIFFVSCEGNKVNGFVVGGACEDLASIRAEFLWKNVLRIAIETLLRPRLYRQAFRRLPSFIRDSEQPALVDASVGLLSIAVSEDAKGMGTAVRLLDAFENNLNGCPRYRLTVMKDNYRARAFYSKMGFRVGEESVDDIFLVKDVATQNEPSNDVGTHEAWRVGLAEKELTRIREQYERRKNLREELYHPLQTYNFMVDGERQLALARWLKWARLSPVANKKVLEIGCGSGRNLLRLMLLGFQPENIVANDLLEDRLQEARHLLPAATTVILGDASELDLPDQSFDVVFQSLTFTSILDDSFQQKLSNRLWAMVKRSGGILWYDYIYSNPKNPDVRGVPVRRIQQLFPEGEMTFWRLTLATPVGRFVTKISPSLYSVFNVVPFLRTHVLCWIRKA